MGILGKSYYFYIRILVIHGPEILHIKKKKTQYISQELEDHTGKILLFLHTNTRYTWSRNIAHQKKKNSIYFSRTRGSYWENLIIFTYDYSLYMVQKYCTSKKKKLN